MITIRMASPEDAGELLEIYTPYILETSITFEYDVPTVEEFRARIAEKLRRHPWLVAQKGDRLLGYAYASRYGGRSAYQWDAEGSIYFRPEAQGTGVAAILYRCLMELLEAQGVRNFYGCITHPNPPSEIFHRKLGFQDIGIFPKAGYKQGQWWDVLWNQHPLGEKSVDPAPPLMMAQLDPRTVAEALRRANAALAAAGKE